MLVQQYAPVTHVAFSASAPFEFAVSSSTRVQIFSPQSNAVRRTLSRFHNVVYGATFRHDGAVLVAGGEEGLVRVCDVHSREVLRTLSGHVGAVHAVQFLDTSSRLASAGDDESVRVWDMATGQALAVLKGHRDRVRSLAVLGGNTLVSGGYDHELRVWDVRAASATAVLSHGAPVECLAAFPHGALLVSGGGPQVQVWDLLRGERAQLLENHQKTVTGVVVDYERERLLSCALDQHVKVYSTQSYQVVHTFKYPAPLLALALSPAKTHLVAGMADGMLSIRHRALHTASDTTTVPKEPSLYDVLADDEATTGKAPSESLNDWRYWNRGVNETAPDSLAATTNTTASATAAHAARPTALAAYDRFLGKFQYKKALDAALEGGDVAVICSLLEELSARAALSVAVAGRTARSLLPLLAFLERYVSSPAYAALLVPVTLAVLDMYSSVLGQSKSIDKLVRRLHRHVKAECAAQRHLQHTLGIMDAILAAQQAEAR